MSAASGGRTGAGRWLAALLLVLTGLACGGDGADPVTEPGPAGGGGAQPSTAAGSFAGSNLVILSLDTLRSDRLAAYGGDSGLGRRLQRFAEQAVVFEHARAQAPQTAPSHMSLFTGYYPSVHGVQNVQHGKDPDTGRRRPLIESVPPSIPTLAEVLTAHGYATVGLTDGGNLNPPHGFNRGFDEYTYDLSGAVAQVAAGLEAVDRLQGGDQPWFLFWHTYEIHAPYVSPADYVQAWAPEDYDGLLRDVLAGLDGLDFKQRFAAMKTRFWSEKERFGQDEARFLSGLYDAGIAYTDDELVALLDRLDQPDVADSTLVVILSDHGEEFAEHGKWQHDQVYEEHLRVPLMVRLPGGVGAGTRIATPVALIDVMPTVLELLETPRETLPERTAAPMQGRSLVESLVHGKEPRAREIYSEYRADREGSPLYDWQIAVHHNGFKLIYDEHRSNRAKNVETVELYRLAVDPGERNDLSAEGGQVFQALVGLRDKFHQDLEVFRRLVGEGAAEDLDCEALQQLITLGYLEGPLPPDCQ